MKYLFPLLFITFASLGQNNQPTNNILFGQTLKKDSVIKEFSILYGLLNTFHPGQFMHCDKIIFDRCYDSLSKSIRADLSVPEYYCKTTFLISKIKDGHTWAGNSEFREALKTRLVFPFSIYKINDNFILSKAGSKDYDYLIGKTISKINGKTINELVSNIKSYLSIEGTNETAINNSFQLFPFYYFLIDTSQTFKISLIDSLDDVQELTLKGIEYGTYKSNTRKIVEPIEQSFKENIAILTVNTFNFSDYEYKKINYKVYIDNFFKQVSKMKINNLIIDVRTNSGGAPEISSYLFSYLANKPYFYFEYVGIKYKKAGAWKYFSTDPQDIYDIDTTKFKYINNLYCETQTDKNARWWFKQQNCKKKNYQGNLVVLINGGCFSTTGHFLALLRDNHIGKLYGECSQGSFYSNDGGHSFQLPYSKTLLGIPTAQFKMRMPNFSYDSKGICPDIEVLKSPKDFKTNYDRQLNCAIEELLGRK